MGIQISFREGRKAYLAQADYDAFRKEVIQKLRTEAKSEFTVKEARILKNNSVQLKGVTLNPSSSDVSPTIYLERFYACYRRGILTTDEIVREILRICREDQDYRELNINDFPDFDRMKDKVICHLVNYDRNRELLKDIPHRRWLDLAVIYKIYLGEMGPGFGSVTVQNQHLLLWDTDEGTLFQLARVNTERLFPPEIRNMTDILCECGFLTRAEPAPGLIPPGSPEEVPMYVLTNPEEYYGASCLLYPGIKKLLSRIPGCDFYLLPSSVNELILVPVTPFCNGRDFYDIVREVNALVVPEEQFLSDRVYFYSLKARRFKEICL